MNISLTSHDRKILAQLQKDAAITIEKLARLVGLSASATQRRLQTLRDAKVITGECAVVDPKAVGMNLTLIVELEVEHDRPERLAGLHKWLATQPEIQNAWHITGRGDYVISLMVSSIEDFDAFMAKLTASNPNVRKYTSSVALKTLRRSLSVPV
jgi:Lrp/AsnC family transcriptional regulator, leucine-responsive regulatory protein